MYAFFLFVCAMAHGEALFVCAMAHGEALRKKRTSCTYVARYVTCKKRVAVGTTMYQVRSYEYVGIPTCSYMSCTCTTCST